MDEASIINKIVQEFLKQLNFEVDKETAHHFVHVLSRDARVGLDIQNITTCKTDMFLKVALEKYKSKLDPTGCNLRMKYYFRNCCEINFECAKEGFNKHFQVEIKKLIDAVLQYPETSNDRQIEEMCMKMQVFIASNYDIGCPKDHVLLAEIRRSLRSVLGKDDLKNYVLKKKYHREEYLQRLSATVCGIIIYNNYGPDGDKTHMRDLFADLQTTQKRVHQALGEALQRANDGKTYGSGTIEQCMEVSLRDRKIHYSWPMYKLHDINRYVVLFTIYGRYISELQAICKKMEFIIENDKTKFRCVVDRIHHVLAFRTAINTEKIFPHFVYLSEIWTTLLQYLNFITQIGEIGENLDGYICSALEDKFYTLVNHARTLETDFSKETDFVEINDKLLRRNSRLNNIHIKNGSAEYCSLTLSITNGLLVPATLQKRLCSDSSYGFKNIDYAKFSERHINDYSKMFRQCITYNVDMSLLFDIENDILQLSAKKGPQKHPGGVSTVDTQTEAQRIDETDPRPSKRINYAWNSWVFHREAIHLANMRKTQTHSTETAVSYAKRNANNQTYNSRKHF